jgi:phosphatidylserine decarboxylase
MAMVLVGAINVAAIETVWDGLVTPPTQAATQVKTFDNVVLEQGAEMGRFNMGSTVILLFADSKLQWESNSQADQAVQLGQVLAKFQ